MKQLNWQGALCILLVLLIWEGADRIGLLTTRLLPAPSIILSVLPTVAVELPRALSQTLIRMGAGLALAALIGLPLGIAAGRSEHLWLLLAPTVETCRSLPPAMVILPAMLLLGIGDAMKIFAVGFATVFPLLLSAMDSARAIPVRYLDTARTLGASRMSTLRAVILLRLLPGLFSGLRTALPIAFIVSILAEMIGGTDGIGHFLMRSQRTFDLPSMYAAILATSLTGVVLNLILNRIESTCPACYAPRRRHGAQERSEGKPFFHLSE